MKRLLAIFAIVLVATAACDDDTADDGAGELAETDEVVDDDTADELIETHRQLVGRTFSAMSELYETSCECAYGDLGFDAEADCRDELVVADGVIEDGETCVESAARAHEDSPTEGVGDYLSCVEAELDAIEDCFASARDDHDASCADEASQAWGECGEVLGSAMETNFATCSDGATIAARSWINAVQRRATDDGCFADVTVAR